MYRTYYDTSQSSILKTLGGLGGLGGFGSSNSRQSSKSSSPSNTSNVSKTPKIDIKDVFKEDVSPAPAATSPVPTSSVPTSPAATSPVPTSAVPTSPVPTSIEEEPTSEPIEICMGDSCTLVPKSTTALQDMSSAINDVVLEVLHYLGTKSLIANTPVNVTSSLDDEVKTQIHQLIDKCISTIPALPLQQVSVQESVQEPIPEPVSVPVPVQEPVQEPVVINIPKPTSTSPPMPAKTKNKTKLFKPLNR